MLFKLNPQERAASAMSALGQTQSGTGLRGNKIFTVLTIMCGAASVNVIAEWVVAKIA